MGISASSLSRRNPALWSSWEPECCFWRSAGFAAAGNPAQARLVGADLPWGMGRAYSLGVTLTRRSLLAAVSAAAAAQAQRRYPNWKPRLGVLCQYTDANVEFVKAEGFTSMQLRLDPAQLDDAAIAAIKDKIQRSGIYVSSLAVDGNHIDPDPAAREKQNKFTIACLELCGKLGIPNIGGNEHPN